MALARLPGSVLKIIAADASCDVVWLCSRRSGTRDVLRLSDICAASEKLLDSDSTDWKLVYDVMRVHRGSVVLAQDHMQRISSNCSTFIGAASDIDVSDIASAIGDYIRAGDGVSCDVNLKFITWIPLSRAPCADRLEYAVYFIRSFYPPAHWYAAGARAALLYDAQRESPGAKTVQSALRARAAALQKAAGAFEALLVRGRAGGFLVPEGSRSNFVLAMADGRLLCSREADVLVGVTLRAVRRGMERQAMARNGEKEKAMARNGEKEKAMARDGEKEKGIEHRALVVGDLCAAAGIVMLGTSPGVLPIAEIVVCSDAESRRSFGEALAAYEGVAESEALWTAARDAGEKAMAGDGVLRFDSATNEALRGLREAYEAEAYGEQQA